MEEEIEKMKAIARFGKEFGGYRMIDVPKPTCGPDDIIIEIKAAAICGADMKHWRVDNGSDEFNSVRGHEFAGDIVEVGENVKDWKVGQRVVSDNSAHVCGVCPACEQGDFLLRAHISARHVYFGQEIGESGFLLIMCRVYFFLCDAQLLVVC